MRKAAFYLLASVIGFQLVIIAGVLSACFYTNNGRCTGQKAGDLMGAIVGQCFALYAAEKGS